MRALVLLIALAVSANYSGVVLKSCSGCRLNKLPLVKKFILEEAPTYELEVLYVGGDPRMVFLDEYGTEVYEENVSEYDVQGIKYLLEKHGFKPKTASDASR